MIYFKIIHAIWPEPGAYPRFEDIGGLLGFLDKQVLFWVLFYALWHLALKVYVLVTEKFKCTSKTVLIMNCDVKNISSC